MGAGITSVEIIKSWGTSPARISRQTGALQINEDYLPLLLSNRDYADLVIKHEYTHRKKNTADEFEADAGASNLYFKEKRSPRNSVLAMNRLLSFSTDEHLERLRAQFIRAAQYDCTVNGNKIMCDMLSASNINNTPGLEKFSFADVSNGRQNYADFCGPICRKRNARIANAVNAAINNNATVQNTIQTAVSNAAQNTPPAAAQPNTAAPAGAAAGGTDNSGGSTGGSIGLQDDGSDDDTGFNGFAGMTPRQRAEYNRRHRQLHTGFDNFCGPICEMRKNHDLLKEQQSADKKTIALAQVDSANKQAALDNQQKAIEAQTAAQENEQVAKSLKTENGGGTNHIVIGVVLLLLIGFVFIIKNKKAKTA